MIRKKNIGRLTEQGNAMIYVLIALALFGFLTVTLSNQNDQADGQDLDDEIAELYANEIIQYSSTAQYVVDMMTSTGSETIDLNFVNPTSTGFNTGSHIHKVFHPQGGGLNYEPTFKKDIQNDATSVWALATNINVEWTPSSDHDTVLTAYFINKSVCEQINKKIIGNTTIPATANPHSEYFIDQTRNLTVSECAACDGYPSLCIENDTGDNYSFYSIIAAQ